MEKVKYSPVIDVHASDSGPLQTEYSQKQKVSLFAKNGLSII